MGLAVEIILGVAAGATAASLCGCETGVSRFLRSYHTDRGTAESLLQAQLGGLAQAGATGYGESPREAIPCGFIGRGSDSPAGRKTTLEYLRALAEASDGRRVSVIRRFLKGIGDAGLPERTALCAALMLASLSREWNRKPARRNSRPPLRRRR